MTFLFWFSAFMIFYAYWGYPFALIVISIFKKSDNLGHVLSAETDYQPPVSFIITAYNEEKRIEDKIRSTLALDYPKEKLEIIVASDCSNDKTDSIVKAFGDKGVRLVRAQERKGKENAQKLAVEASQGNIIIFSDVATHLEPDGIAQIVKNFSNSLIGCVSSEDRFIDSDGKISGEGAYVKYEMFLRKLEAKVNTVVGLSGSFFAARREVCMNWAVDLQSDFNTLLNSVKAGLKGVSDPKSIGYYRNLSDEKKEFDRKIRTVLRGISVLMQNLSLLNPTKYGMFSWQLFSHKICRWLVPFFLFFVFISNAFISGHSILYFLIMMMQIGFYSLAAFHHRKLSRSSRNEGNDPHRKCNKGKEWIDSTARIAYFFIMVNASIAIAWYKYSKGERAIFWQPSKR